MRLAKFERKGRQSRSGERSLLVHNQKLFSQLVFTGIGHDHAFGNQLNDGDYVTLVKDLKVKGSSSVAKIGTKVKIIRLVDGDHNIDCRIEGIGSMMLKSEFVKKA